MPRGLKTTEFWITVAVNVAVLTAALVDILPPRYAAIASAVSASAYSIARGLAKLNSPVP